MYLSDKAVTGMLGFMWLGIAAALIAIFVAVPAMLWYLWEHLVWVS